MGPGTQAGGRERRGALIRGEQATPSKCVEHTHTLTQQSPVRLPTIACCACCPAIPLGRFLDCGCGDKTRVEGGVLWEEERCECFFFFFGGGKVGVLGDGRAWDGVAGVVRGDEGESGGGAAATGVAEAVRGERDEYAGGGVHDDVGADGGACAEAQGDGGDGEHGQGDGARVGVWVQDADSHGS